MKKQLSMVLMVAAIAACKGRDKEHQAQKGVELPSAASGSGAVYATEDDESGGTGTAMALEEGKMGKKDSDRAEGQYKMRNAISDPQLAREQAIDQARNAGILGGVKTKNGGAFASLTSEPEPTTPIAVRTNFNALALFSGASQFETPTGYIAAAAVVVTVPVVVLVLLFQRRIVAGLTNGAVKG